MLPRGIALLNSLPPADGRPSADTAVHRWRRVYALGGCGHWPPSAARECRPHGGGKRGKTTKVFFPLLTPQTFLRTRLPSVARLNARGPQGRLLLQEHILDRSGAFRSANQAPCTVWPRTVMRGGLRKVNSGHNSIPKSARRPEPSPRNPRLAANASLSSLKEGLGCQEGKGNHRCPVPSCFRRQTAAMPRHVMANIPRPGRASLASSGEPLYRRR